MATFGTFIRRLSLIYFFFFFFFFFFSQRVVLWFNIPVNNFSHVRAVLSFPGY